VSWSGARAESAADRILEAAARLFAERGIATVGMADVAAAAGCSRATLYRHFENRGALQLAFAHREARRIVAEVTAGTAGIADPDRRRVEAILATVEAVRGAPQLAAWLRTDNVATLQGILDSSEIVDGFVRAFLPPGAQPDAGRWLLRMILSYVVLPGRDAEEERRQLTEFVVPTLSGSRV
jgi:AcrR family transcriptional regulator